LGAGDVVVQTVVGIDVFVVDVAIVANVAVVLSVLTFVLAFILTLILIIIRTLSLILTIYTRRIIQLLRTRPRTKLLTSIRRGERRAENQRREMHAVWPSVLTFSLMLSIYASVNGVGGWRLSWIFQTENSSSSGY
jgi:hypothetical protein